MTEIGKRPVCPHVWGNRTNEAPSKCTGYSMYTPADSASKNRISGTCYDLAGNYLGWNGCPGVSE